MRVRVVAGRLKGRVITLGGARAACRPTADRVRESVAQILSARIEGARVADLCAGSGAFGFEMLSRGAHEAHFVESDRGRARAIEAAAAQFGVAGQVRVWAEDIRRFAGRGPRPFDIAYFDPPYEDDTLAGLVPALLPLVSEGGLLVHERSSRRAVAALPPDAAAYLSDTRTYGATAVDFYTTRAPSQPDGTAAAGGKGD